MTIKTALGAASRRDVLAAGAGLLSLTVAQPARALPEDIAGAIREFAGDAPIKRGRVHLEIPPLVENGNSVSILVKVESPMTSENHVKTIAVFNEKNPQPNVANFHLGPRSGEANVTARIRLATSQTITAVAEMSDGTYWSDSKDVIVTIAACTEE